MEIKKETSSIHHPNIHHHLSVKRALVILNLNHYSHEKYDSSKWRSLEGQPIQFCCKKLNLGLQLPLPSAVLILFNLSGFRKLRYPMDRLCQQWSPMTYDFSVTLVTLGCQAETLLVRASFVTARRHSSSDSLRLWTNQ